MDTEPKMHLRFITVWSKRANFISNWGEWRLFASHSTRNGISSKSIGQNIQYSVRQFLQFGMAIVFL